MDWPSALKKIGMTLMITMGGASGSLYGTLFISMAKALPQDQDLTRQITADMFEQGVESVKQRGKASLGEKTMLDTLIPVANRLKDDNVNGTELPQLLNNLSEQAITGMLSTKDMVATKGRASFLGERAIGHIDAGAKTSQLIICTITDFLSHD